MARGKEPPKPNLALAETALGEPADASSPALDATMQSDVGLAATMHQSTSQPAAVPSLPPASLPGTELDHYRVEQLVGQGGMGAVYQGWDQSLDRPVALKVLRSEVTGREGQRDRFLREARAQAKLNHPNVVHIYFIGHQRSGALYFAMEFVDGQSLGSLSANGETLDPEQARKDMIAVAKGLRAGHDAGIIHRDVKPSNLMRTPDGGVKIADFGLAKPMREDVQITQEGSIVGSPLYIAPEQARGKNVDHRSDMYSLGASFYHLLSGAPPFDGDTGIEVIAQHLADPPKPLRSVVPQVPPKLAAVIDRLLEKKIEKRFSDYDELIGALEAAAPNRTQYACFWARAAAMVIDTGIAAALIAVIGWPGIVIHFLHVTLGHAFYRRTLAKAMLRLQVSRPDGRRLNLLRSAARTAVSLWLPLLSGLTVGIAQGTGPLISAIEQLNAQELDDVQNLFVAIAISNGFLTLLYGAGLAIAAFHPEKRALHDLAAGSVVTYRLG
ncbi:MAG: protein kinase [Myxococcota bacterium]